MPLSFDTKNHGEIAIGFFNIDTDMILIKNYFCFASDLCGWISGWAAVDDDLETTVEIYVIKKPENIGNLMGAISGTIFTGFIGEVYKIYPFPQKHEEFRQKPDGAQNRSVVEDIIQRFGKQEDIKIMISKGSGTITIGEYVFSKDQFHEVISYIWRGGMPKWKDGEEPEYVKTMMRSIVDSKHWLFKPVE